MNAFEGELAVKLHTKDVEVGARANRNPIEDKNHYMVRVHSP